MAQWSSTLSSCVIVTGLICLFLLMSFSVIGQGVITNNRTKDSSGFHLPHVPSRDSITKKTDSLKNAIAKDIKGLSGDVKTAKRQLKELTRPGKKAGNDTIPGHKTAIGPGKIMLPSADSMRQLADSSFRTAVTTARSKLSGKIKKTKEGFLSVFNFRKGKNRDSSKLKQTDAPPTTLLSKPLLKFGGGYISYDYNYRSAIDTPFAEKNIGQHNITGSIGTTIAKALPFRINFWIRRSNSILYRDITDVQVSFDPAGFRNELIGNMRNRLLSLKPSVDDSLLEKIVNLKSFEFSGAKKFLFAPVTIQRIHEAKEFVEIDAAHPENRPADSVARKLFERQVNETAAFIRLYDSTRLRYDTLTGIVNSLERKFMLQKRKYAQLRQTINGNFSGWSSYEKWKEELDKYNPGSDAIPQRYKWLMGIRSFNLGKIPLNYSELTAKNVSVSGINFEYNSWYYLAVTAGVVDYRFRDFVVSDVKRGPQYLYMLRAGIGKIERNYFIVSVLKGKKQLYSLPTTSGISNSLSFTGITAESKWQINNHGYFIAEAGESISPDYRSTPPQGSGKFTLSGNTNKALSLKLFYSFPALSSRLEGLYKYTGANYQSFSSFQTNSATKSWYIKWEQNFFQRKLRITGAVRSNEFTNPYIVQNYKSNTVFKSISAVFRMRNLPIITVGYIPMSQLAVAGQQIIESRFQTLTVSASHFYKIGNRQAFTNVVYNKFYNTNTDSGFIYFNASNFYLSQNVVFRLFTAGIGIADSRSNQYHLIAGEVNLRIPLIQNTVVGIGLKVNNLNQQETRTGGKFNIELGITKKDRISVNYEKSYLPGMGKQLVNTEMGNIQYNRYF